MFGCPCTSEMAIAATLRDVMYSMSASSLSSPRYLSAEPSPSLPAASFSRSCAASASANCRCTVSAICFVRPGASRSERASLSVSPLAFHAITRCMRSRSTLAVGRTSSGLPTICARS